MRRAVINCAFHLRVNRGGDGPSPVTSGNGDGPSPPRPGSSNCDRVEDGNRLKEAHFYSADNIRASLRRLLQLLESVLPAFRRALGAPTHALLHATLRGYLFGVAQICNLLDRRIAFCGAPASSNALELSDAPPIANRRYTVAQICNLSVSMGIVAGCDDFRDAPDEVVAQVSKPAVSPTSKSAARWSSDGLRIWKSATQQTWKSALLWLRLGRAALYRRIVFCGASAIASALELSDALPITNWRYGRLQICATRPHCALTITIIRRIAAATAK